MARGRRPSGAAAAVTTLISAAIVAWAGAAAAPTRDAPHARWHVLRSADPVPAPACVAAQVTWGAAEGQVVLAALTPGADAAVRWTATVAQAPNAAAGQWTPLPTAPQLLFRWTPDGQLHLLGSLALAGNVVTVEPASAPSPAPGAAAHWICARPATQGAAPPDDGGVCGTPDDAWPTRRAVPAAAAAASVQPRQAEEATVRVWLVADSYLVDAVGPGNVDQWLQDVFAYVRSLYATPQVEVPSNTFRPAIELQLVRTTVWATRAEDAIDEDAAIGHRLWELAAWASGTAFGEVRCRLAPLLLGTTMPLTGDAFSNRATPCSSTTW